MTFLTTFDHILPNFISYFFGHIGKNITFAAAKPLKPYNLPKGKYQ